MPASEQFDQVARFEWWANDSFMIGPVEVLVTADGGRGRVRDTEGDEVEGLEFLCQLDPVMLLVTKAVKRLVVVHLIETPGHFTTSDYQGPTERRGSVTFPIAP